MATSWDGVQYNGDGTFNANFYIDDVDYALCYEIYNREPQGDKYDMRGEIVRDGKRYIVMVEGKPGAVADVWDPNLRDHIKKLGRVPCGLWVKWRAYDDEPRFMIGVTLNNV